MSGLEGLHRISLLLVLVGLTLLYASSLVFKPETVAMSDIGQDHLGEQVRVAGAVRGLSETDDAVFFDVEEGNAEIRAVHFGPGLEIEEGGRYTFEGRVDIYQGELELVVASAVSGESFTPHPG